MNEQTLKELVDEDSQNNFKQLHANTFEKGMKAKKEKEFVKCFDSITFSEFNPAPPARKMVGDLFYLTVKTLDVGEKGITCCVNGFYLNENVERSSFNPLPSQKKSAITGKSSAAFSYTLIGCLNQISGVFSKNLEVYMN